MKKLMLMVMVVAMMLSCVGCKGKSKSMELYYLPTNVIEVNGGEEIVCVDAEGNEWVFYSMDDWTVGEGCTMFMSDNYTSMVEDDVILDVKHTSPNRF